MGPSKMANIHMPHGMQPASQLGRRAPRWLYCDPYSLLILYMAGPMQHLFNVCMLTHGASLVLACTQVVLLQHLHGVTDYRRVSSV